MKLTITMKNPDSFEDSIRRAAEDEVRITALMNPNMREELIEDKYEELKRIASKWFEDNEYVRIEIDTQKNTATVLQV